MNAWWRFSFFLTLLVVVAQCFLTSAHASTSTVMQVKPDGTGMLSNLLSGPVNSSVAAGDHVPLRGSYNLAGSGPLAGANGPYVSGAYNVVHRDPFGRVTTIPVKQVITVPKAALAGAARVAARALPLVGLGVAILEVLTEGGITPAEDQGEFNKAGTDYIPAPIQLRWFTNYQGPNPANQCLRDRLAEVTVIQPAGLKVYFDQCAPAGTTFSGNRIWSDTFIESGTTSRTYTRKACSTINGDCSAVANWLSVSAGATPYCEYPQELIGSQCAIASITPATDSDIELAVQNTDQSKQLSILNALLAAGQAISLSGSSPSTVTVESPDFETIPQTSTRTYTDAEGNPQTETTVSTQTGTVTGQGTTIATSTVTTTITNITNVYRNGVLVSSEESGQPLPTPEEEPDPEPEPTVDFEDPDFPGVPDLYEQKYEEGLVGVWNAKKGELMGSQFITDVQSIFQNVPGSGSCPAFTMPVVNLGPTNFSEGDVSPPCWLWDVVGLFFLVTACFRAWQIVF